jgi:hypothetical protein
MCTQSPSKLKLDNILADENYIEFISKISTNKEAVPAWYKPHILNEETIKIPKKDVYSAYVSFHKDRGKAPTSGQSPDQTTYGAPSEKKFWGDMSGFICDANGKARSTCGKKNGKKVPFIIWYTQDEIENNIKTLDDARRRSKEKNNESNRIEPETQKKISESSNNELYNTEILKEAKAQTGRSSNYGLQTNNASSNNNNMIQTELLYHANKDTDSTNENSSDIDETEIDTHNEEKSSAKNSKDNLNASKDYINLDFLEIINADNPTKRACLDNHKSIIDEENHKETTTNNINNLESMDNYDPSKAQNSQQSHDKILDEIDELGDEIYERAKKFNLDDESVYICKEHLQSIKDFLEGLQVGVKESPQEIYCNEAFKIYFPIFYEIMVLVNQIYELSSSLETHDEFNLATCKDRLLAVKEFLENENQIKEQKKKKEEELNASMYVDDENIFIEKPQKPQKNQQKQQKHTEQQEIFVNSYKKSRALPESQLQGQSPQSQNMTYNNGRQWDIKFLDTVEEKEKNLSFYIIRYDEKKIIFPLRTINTLLKRKEKYVSNGFI